MNSSKYHSMSSSEKESDDDDDDVNHDFDDSFHTVNEESSGGMMKPEILKEIILKVKGVHYNFNEVANSSSHPVLYSNEITDDDEMWLIQTPKQVNLNSLAEMNLRFGKNVSQTTLNSRKRKKTFNVFNVKPTGEIVNCVLPEKNSEKFHLNVYPVAGRMILQEDSRTEESENFNESKVNLPLKLESDFSNLTHDSEDIAPKRKKKKKKH